MTAPTRFTLSMAQMRVDGGEIDANLRRAEQFVARAADVGAQVVLLPEALDVGWTHPSARELAEPIPAGRSCETLRRAASKHRLHVCAGLVERAGNVFYNAAVLIDPTGEVILHHRKLNELEIGHHLYAQGNRLATADTPLGRIGVMICADAFARGQTIARTLGYMGADVILSPSAWAVRPGHDNRREPYGQIWRDSYGKVAKDFSLWVAGVSNVGTISAGAWQGWNCIGCSLVVDPSGSAVLQGPYGAKAETLLTAQMRPVTRPTRGAGWNKLWQSQTGRQ